MMKSKKDLKVKYIDPSPFPQVFQEGHEAELYKAHYTVVEDMPAAEALDKFYDVLSEEQIKMLKGE